MIPRGVSHFRRLTPVVRRLSPISSSQVVMEPSPPELQKPPLLRSYSSLIFSQTPSFRLPCSTVRLNFQYNVRKNSLSTSALADVPAGGIVDVPLAQTGEGIAECELLKWFVQEGDHIEEFQPICEVQSDKATIEITSRYKGKVVQILYAPGDIVKVGETLLKVVVEDFDLQAVVSDTIENIESSAPETVKSNKAGVLSTPAVRGLAKEYGIDITDVQATGTGGRVLKEDVIRYAIEKGIMDGHAASLDTNEEDKILGTAKSHEYVGHKDAWQEPHDKPIPLRGYHRSMVKSMTMAAKVPHFHYVEEINCDALVDLKTSFQDSNTDPGVKYTFLPVLIKSLSMALSKYPLVNSCFNEESMEVILKGSHNIGIAMATSNGLVVPNIKNVQTLSILEITKELARLHQCAQENKLTPEDITGGTITLSNIGAIGGKFGSPLLNLPEVSIIAVGRIQKAPYFSDDGSIYPVSVMTVNMGADHRVLDGATVARFCNEWKKYIEKPELLMLLMR